MKDKVFGTRDSRREYEGLFDERPRCRGEQSCAKKVMEVVMFASAARYSPLRSCHTLSRFQTIVGRGVVARKVKNACRSSKKQ